MRRVIGCPAEHREILVVRVTPAAVAAKRLDNPALHPGRGHEPGEPTPLYGSESRATARCEFQTHHPEFTGVVVRHTTLRAKLVVVDLTSPIHANLAGTSIDELVSEDWTACQDVVTRAFAGGAKAVRLRSVRLPGGVNVVVEHGAAKGSLRVIRVDYRPL